MLFLPALIPEELKDVSYRGSHLSLRRSYASDCMGKSKDALFHPAASQQAKPALHLPGFRQNKFFSTISEKSETCYIAIRKVYHKKSIGSSNETNDLQNQHQTITH